MKLLFSFIGVLGVSLSVNNTPLKAINVIPGGQNIGIEIKPGGLIVSGTYNIEYEGKTHNPSDNNNIIKGDIITKANDIQVKSIDDFLKVFYNSNSDITNVKLTIKRKSKFYNKNLKIIKVNNRYKTGLFVKERLLGVGTVSFYDENTKMYGALGHEITDSSSNEIIDVDEGTIYDSNVTSIKPSENSSPGEKIADIYFDMPLGDIKVNTPLGIYGRYNELPKNSSSLPIAELDEIKTGKAEMWTVVNSNKIEKYAIEITKLHSQTQISTKGIIFKVTDPRLLKLSHGIVAGMSGSPIIQDNKVVGAVTHVLIDDVDNGYAVYMKWMFETANEVYHKYYE